MERLIVTFASGLSNKDHSLETVINPSIFLYFAPVGPLGTQISQTPSENANQGLLRDIYHILKV